MIDLLIGLIAVIGTIMIYFLARKVHQKIPIPLLLPIILATMIIIILLVLFDIPYETYMIGGDWINQLLGPAVVALAYPLYQQRETLKKFILPILIGTFFGAVIGISSGVLLTKWAGFTDTLIYSITPKSVTTPIAMDIAQSIGGIMPLAAIFVIIAGVSGGIMAPPIYKLLSIEHDVSRGLSLGSASHAIGTAQALEYGNLAGSIGSIAMVLSAIFVSLISAPLIALLM